MLCFKYSFIKRRKVFYSSFHVKIIFENLIEGVPLFIHSLINIIRQRVDKLIVAATLIPEVAARYGLISTYAMTLGVFYTAVSKFLIVGLYESILKKTNLSLILMGKKQRFGIQLFFS